MYKVRVDPGQVASFYRKLAKEPQNSWLNPMLELVKQIEGAGRQIVRSDLAPAAAHFVSAGI
jgi:hypothetical protein